MEHFFRTTYFRERQNRAFSAAAVRTYGLKLGLLVWLGLGSAYASDLFKDAPFLGKKADFLQSSWCKKAKCTLQGKVNWNGESRFYYQITQLKNFDPQLMQLDIVLYKNQQGVTTALENLNFGTSLEVDTAHTLLLEFATNIKLPVSSLAGRFKQQSFTKITSKAGNTYWMDYSQWSQQGAVRDSFYVSTTEIFSP